MSTTLLQQGVSFSRLCCAQPSHLSHSVARNLDGWLVGFAARA